MWLFIHHHILYIITCKFHWGEVYYVFARCIWFIWSMILLYYLYIFIYLYIHMFSKSDCFEVSIHVHGVLANPAKHTAPPPPRKDGLRRGNNFTIIVSKNFPTYPWNIPQALNLFGVWALRLFFFAGQQCKLLFEGAVIFLDMFIAFSSGGFDDPVIFVVLDRVFSSLYG